MIDARWIMASLLKDQYLYRRHPIEMLTLKLRPHQTLQVEDKDEVNNSEESNGKT